MADLTLDPPPRRGARAARTLGAELLLGAGYWAAFLLALEPGNLLQAAGVGHPLALGSEATRIIAASALGALSAPLAYRLVRRLPIEGEGWARRLAIHAGAIAVLALLLIASSCLLALIPIGGRPIGNPDFGVELTANGLLLVFALAGLDGLVHILQHRAGPRAQPVGDPETYLQQTTVRTRAGLVVIRMDDVDWIESQGNYQALHVGPSVHLVRETSARLEAQLDPARFMRIHRRALVALDRVQALTARAGGDADLTLRCGRKLRLSRNYREPVQAQLEGKSCANRSPVPD